MKQLKLPGLIDVHVHLREPGATYKEDFATGTKAAIAGGYTAILDMPNNPQPTTTPQALDKKIDLASGRIFCDVGFNFGATTDSIKYFQQIKDRVFGLKVYMNHTTGSLLEEDPTVLEAIFSAWPEDKIVMVHAEDQTLIKAINLARKYGKKLHVCHVSLKREIERIKKAKEEDLSISCEVTCHHLFLTEKDLKRLEAFGLMRPPLTTKEDQDALWEGINDGTIDMIASDHAPHTKKEKLTINPPNGVPGLETTLPLLLTALKEGRLTEERLIELTFLSPQRIFNVSTQFDTMVEIDMDRSYVVDPKSLYSKCDWTPFAGIEVLGKIKRVVLKGRVVFDGQNILGPFGQVINPKNVIL